jgi:hypothetical protein
MSLSLNGDEIDARSSICTFLPASSLIETPRWSSVVSIIAPTGRLPSKLIAIFKTQPGRSKLHGGVSLQPPTKSTRTGNSTKAFLGCKLPWVEDMELLDGSMKE